MSKTLHTGVLIWLSLVPAAWGKDTPAAPAPAPSVEQLIEQLGAPDFRTREAASKALEARGPEALPALRKARNHADPEVQRRLAKLLPILEKAAALTPRRVTLRLTQRPLREAVAELARQSGYAIKLEQPDKPDQALHSFDLDRVTFWEAVEKICAAGSLRSRLDPGDATVLLSRQSDETITHRNGCFVLSALGLQNIGLAKDEKYLSVVCTITTEPKLALLSVQHPILTEAVDDQKNSLLLPLQIHQDRPDGPAPLHGWANLVYHHPNAIYLSRPGDKLKTVKSIKGTMPVLLLIEQKPEIVIDQVLTVKNRKFQAGDATLHIDEVVRQTKGTRPGYDIRMSIRGEPRLEGNETDFSWVRSLHRRIELLDDKGNKYQVNEPSWPETTPASARGILTFSAPEQGQIGPPARLIYHTWITLWHRVDFEFHDMPLP